MILKLTKDVRVVSDGAGFMLQKRMVVKAGPKTRPENVGKERWDFAGSYSALTQAAVAAVRKHLLEMDEELEVGDLITELRSMSQEVARACHQAPSRIKRIVLPKDAKRLDEMISAAVHDSPEV